MRAVVAISDPCPGKYNSKANDVESLFADESSERLSQGQVALKRAVRKANEWRIRSESYAIVGKKDSDIAPAYKQWLARLGTNQFEFEETVELKANLIHWGKLARPGCTKDLLTCFADWAVRRIPSLVEIGDLDAGPCLAAWEILKMADPNQKVAALTELSESLRTMAKSKLAEEVVTNLSRILAGAPNLSADLDQTVQTLESCKGQPLSEAVFQSAVDYRGLLLSAFAAYLKDETPSEKFTAKVEQVQAILLAFDANLQVDKSKAGKDFPRDFTKSVSSIIGNIVQLKTMLKEMPTFDDENQASMPDADQRLLASKLLQFFDCVAASKRWSEECNDPKYSSASKLLETSKFFADQDVSIITDKLLAVMRLNLAKQKSKLDKVSGGTDKGTSWKAPLGKDPEKSDKLKLSDPVMVEALASLRDGFFSCIRKRVPPVREVGSWASGFQSTD